MVKFDISVFKFLSRDHFRVLTSIEMGMKNHEIVPTTLIETIAQMKRGNCFKIVNDLHKHKLVSHNSIPYDGYTLTYRGYDYLAINVFVKRGIIIAIGRQIGVGKESDVFEVFGPKDPTTDISPKYVLKLHRLGRISFRAVKKKRDYLRHNKSKGSWLYLSRLSALKEYGFMKILKDKNFPVPQPIDVCRHAILMSFIDGFPLFHAKKIKKPGILCNKSLALIVKLAQYGLIHCDFNEFNLMVNDDYDLFLIDFPQMISINHKQGIEYFDRDVKCIVNYFKNKHNFEIINENVPRIDSDFVKNEIIDHLDTVVEASGYYGRNEQIHMDDFEFLHQFFASTLTVKPPLKLENGDVNDVEDNKQEQEQEEDELNEKELWQLKKLKKRQDFLKRKALKQAIVEHKESVLQNTYNNKEKTKENKLYTLSETEIRRRLKKKQKHELRKNKYKRARKTADNNKRRRDMKHEMSSNFW